MESKKQQCISAFFNKKDSSKSLSSRPSPISLSKHEGSASTSQQTVKRWCPNILNGAGESKKRKGKFVKQYSQKYLKFWFTVAPCSEQFPLPLCLVCSKVL